jgi:predicted dinucleotide-utilizing enzyme
MNIDLAGLREPLVLFEGAARDGVPHFPANVNIAAVLSMAGIGFDRTRLKVVADPTIKHNTHQISVHGKTGNISIKLENVPAPRIPKPRGSRVTARSRRLSSRNPRSVTGPDFLTCLTAPAAAALFRKKR